jgi:protein TonB
MEEGRFRLLALVGTVLLHVVVVWWLATSPEAAERLLQAMPMDVVDLTPPEPEKQPEPPPPEPEPEPEPVKQAKRQPAKRAEPEPEPEPEAPPPTDAPPSPPPVIDFTAANMAAAGSGTGWGMQASNGGSIKGVYRPGERGGTGTGDTAPAPPPPRPDFSPVPVSSLSRGASPIGTISTRDYPDEARRQYIEGTVRLEVEVRADGTVRNIRVLDEPGGGLGRHAMTQLRRLRWRPALDRQGRPVDSRITYTFRYLLED